MFAILIVMGLDIILVGLKLNELSFPAFVVAFVVPAVLMAGYVLQGIKQDNLSIH
ncbi:hypothetical protein [Acetobacter indonesiensis]|nr:hypothetical protein [Acetobacter indonesiensis]MCI1436794.1 hypothetical protein [Acetobacter indonesiensis]MCI1546083.1 hypothetical protein [Acetobacter indonesiensis]MCI1765529.1 hypothetical protein [Acetobacter indonesiensis]